MVDKKYKGCFAYHFTCLENLENIISHGLLSTNLKNSKKIPHENIANEDIQSRRSNMHVNCGPGGVVHDYVPFYFTKRSPMLLGVVKSKNVDQENIVYLAVPIEYVENESVIFSNASANTNAPPNFYDDPSELKQLNWDAIESWEWNPKVEVLRQQKMAELLIHKEIRIHDITHIVTWDENKAKEVNFLLKKNQIHDLEVVCDTNSFKCHYFSNINNLTERESITTGPKVLLSETSECISNIQNNTPLNPLFKSLEDAVLTIKNNFSCIKELQDIDGLKPKNKIHFEDVGAHSRRVANYVSISNYFKILSQRKQNILIFSAYLHDIGKGPKNRWVDGIQKIDDTHPRKSLPMLERILCEDIGGLENDEIRQIVTLVVYDDIVGDIVANGRSEEQMKKIIRSNTDVDMLITLAKADMKAINPFWVVNHNEAIESLRQRMYNYLKERGGA